MVSVYQLTDTPACLGSIVYTRAAFALPAFP
jgi:hypothetical protein